MAALVASCFTIVSRVPLGVGGVLVTGRFVPDASYTSGGFLISNTLAQNAFGGNIADMIFGTAVRTSDGNQLGITYDPHPSSALGIQGKIRLHNTGQSPHLHDLQASGAVNLASGEHLGIQAGRLAVVGTAATVVSVSGESGVKPSTATGSATECPATFDASAFQASFIAIIV